jgi:phosphatidylinositol glycan class B
VRGTVIESRWKFLTSTWGPVGARLFAAGVLASHAVAAWFNAGFLSADEHYQIIEFAQFKLGRQSATALAWEFPERMRSALQPWLAAIAIHIHHAIGVTSPFTIAFSLRLLSTAIAAAASFELCRRVLRPVSNRFLRQAALFLALLLWITPTAHGRFSSENWGGMWLAIGLCFMLDALDVSSADRRRSTLLAACAGLAWSVAIACRFQMGVAVAGAVLWLLFVRRGHAAVVTAIAVAFAIGFFGSVVLDHWLYGAWTLTPLNYVRVNLIQHRADAYGTGPWWMVAIYLAVVLIPPFSLALIALLVAGSWCARRDVLVWTAVPFIAVHAVIAHKEPRFLLPLLYLIGPWVAVSASSLPARLQEALWRWRRSLGTAVATFCAVDVLFLCVTIVLPVNDRIALDRWLHSQREQGVRTVYALAPRKTGVPAGVTNSFYESGVVFRPVTADRLSSVVTDRPAFVYYRGSETPPELAAIGCNPVFRTYPVWLTGSTLFRRFAEVETDSICRLDGPG